MFTFCFYKNGQSRVEKIKSIEGRRYHNSKGKFWSVPKTEQNLEKLLSIFLGKPLSIDPSLYGFCSEVQSKKVDSSNGKIIQRMSEELRLRGYSRKSRKAYLGHINRFVSKCIKDIRQTEAEEIRQYVLHFLDDKRSSHSHVN